MNGGDLLQKQLPLFRQGHQYASFVLRVDCPLQKPELYHSIYELDRSVMLNEQKSRKLTDKHRCLTGEAFYGEECLILLRSYTRVLGLHIAEDKEESQLVTKMGEGFEIDGIKRISLVSFAALRSIRPPSFSLFKSNHRCSLMLSILRARAAISQRKKS